MKSLKSLILIGILTIGSGIAVSATKDSVDVENLITQWAMSFSQGNTDALMALYTENAVVFPPSSEILNSPAAITSYLHGLKEVGLKQYTISNVDLDIKGNIAYETALWEVTRIDADGNVILLDGNITNVLEKQKDGSWKIKLQSWN